jgi:hypothetical protein
MSNELIADYRRRGWRVLPIPAGRKGPVLSAWQCFEATGDDLPGLFGGGRRFIQPNEPAWSSGLRQGR